MQRHEVIIHSHEGPVAEWLCSGLQNRGHRFNSGLGLHHFPNNYVIVRTGTSLTAALLCQLGGLQNSRHKPAISKIPNQDFTDRVTLICTAINRASCLYLFLLKPLIKLYYWRQISIRSDKSHLFFI